MSYATVAMKAVDPAQNPMRPTGDMERNLRRRLALRPPIGASSGAGPSWRSPWLRCDCSCFGHLAGDIEQSVGKNVGARADTERPVAPEPAPRVLVCRCRPHRPGQESSAVVDWPHRQGVDGLCIPGLGKVPKVLGANTFEFDDRAPELAHEPECDLLMTLLTEKNPAPFAKRDVGEK